jgi:glucose-6-phosphate 1-epimerase
MVKDLNDRFGIPNALQFELDQRGMERAAIKTPDMEAMVYLQGAQITHFQPADHKPLLFLSSKSNFAPGKAIRGGIPIIFPWFGAKADDPEAPMHGFARTTPWKVEDTNLYEDTVVSMVLSLKTPDHIHLRYTIQIASAMRAELGVHNQSDRDFVFEEALHTYLAVSDVRNISISGLENTTFIDKTDAMKKKVSPPEPLRLESETDRVYLTTTTRCRIFDPGWERRINVSKFNSLTTVVWNPWIDKSKKMPDLSPDDWPHFVCVESGNAADNAITLRPGEEHWMDISISATPQSPSSPPP